MREPRLGKSREDRSSSRLVALNADRREFLSFGGGEDAIGFEGSAGESVPTDVRSRLYQWISGPAPGILCGNRKLRIVLHTANHECGSRRIFPWVLWQELIEQKWHMWNGGDGIFFEQNCAGLRAGQRRPRHLA